MATLQQELREWTWTRAWRFGGIAGILFVILAVVGFTAIPPEIPPVYDDPVAEIKTFFTDNDTAYLVGDYISAIGFVIFFLIFLVNLGGVLRSAEGARATWSTLAVVGGVVGLAFGGVAAFFWNALALQAASDGNDAIVQTLMYLQFVTDSSVPMVMALLVFGSSVVIIRTGVLWKWLAWLGFPLSLAAVLAPIAVIEGDPEGVFAILGEVVFVVFLVWSVAVSVAMIMKKDLPASAQV